MIVAFDVKSDVADRSLSFIQYPITRKVSGIKCNETIAQLYTDAANISGLLIPAEILNADYDVQYFIEHLRLDADQKISRLPVVIFAASDEEYYSLLDKPSGFKEEFYKRVGVTVSIDPQQEDFNLDLDQNALDIYLAQSAQESKYGGGRHDRANVWGAFSIMNALRIGYPDEVAYQNEADALRTRLVEDTFYKKKLLHFPIHNADPKFCVKLKSTRDKCFKAMAGLTQPVRVLVVEDQLGDGWEKAYLSLLGNENQRCELVFAGTYEDALKAFTPDIGLVLLDMRLDPDREGASQQVDEKDVSQLSGVRLARKFRERAPAVPIVAATASNKAWTLEALLDHGVNGYWVKEAPEHSVSVEHVLENAIAFYTTLDKVISWSSITRPWIDAFYRISQNVMGDDHTAGSAVENKAKSFHALMHRSFSPFSQEMSAGLQLDVAFITVYSLLNELIDWICQFQEDEHGLHRVLTTEFDGSELNILQEDKEKKEYILMDEAIQLLSMRDGTYEYRQFPDVLVFRCLLEMHGLGQFVRKFNRLKDVRNHVSLTHGKLSLEDFKGNTALKVTEQHITDLLQLYADLVSRRAGS